MLLNKSDFDLTGVIGVVTKGHANILRCEIRILGEHFNIFELLPEFFGNTSHTSTAKVPQDDIHKQFVQVFDF